MAVKVHTESSAAQGQAIAAGAALVKSAVGGGAALGPGAIGGNTVWLRKSSGEAKPSDFLTKLIGQAAVARRVCGDGVFWAESGRAESTPRFVVGVEVCAASGFAPSELPAQVWGGAFNGELAGVSRRRPRSVHKSM